MWHSTSSSSGMQSFIVTRSSLWFSILPDILILEPYCRAFARYNVTNCALPLRIPLNAKFEKYFFREGGGTKMSAVGICREFCIIYSPNSMNEWVLLGEHRIFYFISTGIGLIIPRTARTWIHLFVISSLKWKSGLGNSTSLTMKNFKLVGQVSWIRRHLSFLQKGLTNW